MCFHNRGGVSVAILFTGDAERQENKVCSEKYVRCMFRVMPVIDLISQNVGQVTPSKMTNINNNSCFSSSGKCAVLVIFHQRNYLFITYFILFPFQRHYPAIATIIRRLSTITEFQPHYCFNSSFKKTKALIVNHKMARH